MVCQRRCVRHFSYFLIQVKLDRDSHIQVKRTTVAWLKGCPKCEGDLYLRKDAFGPYRSCLQCGYQDDPDAPRLANLTWVSSPSEVVKTGRPKLPGTKFVRQNKEKLAA